MCRASIITRVRTNKMHCCGQCTSIDGVAINSLLSTQLTIVVSFVQGVVSIRRRLAVIRLSLGKLLVNLLQVVKRTNTLLIP